MWTCSHLHDDSNLTAREQQIWQLPLTFKAVMIYTARLSNLLYAIGQSWFQRRKLFFPTLLCTCSWTLRLTRRHGRHLPELNLFLIISKKMGFKLHTYKHWIWNGMYTFQCTHTNSWHTESMHHLACYHSTSYFTRSLTKIIAVSAKFHVDN